MDSISDIEEVCNNLKSFLIKKYKRYGDSVLHPIRVFSRASNIAQITTRIDDKLSRIKNSDELRKNDAVDLAGYLILLCIANDWMDFKEFLD